MSKVKIQGHASGTGVLTVTAPNTSTDRTITLPDATGTLLTTTGSGANLTGVGVDGISSSADATAMTIGADENIGIGVVPKAWHSSGVALQVGAGGCVKGHTTDERVALLSNAYEAASDGNWKRVLTGLAANVNLDNGVFNFETGVTGSADSNITWTNPVQIDAEGIKFNGDTATANALDDYEEGTWTPTVLGTNSCSMSTIHQSNYTKIGNVVKLYTSFNVASSASPATGTMAFGGFPFSFKTSGETAFLISLHYNYKDTPMAFVNQNGNIYYQNGTTGGNNLGDLTTGFDSVTVVGMNFTYLTS